MKRILFFIVVALISMRGYTQIQTPEQELTREQKKELQARLDSLIPEFGISLE